MLEQMIVALILSILQTSAETILVPLATAARAMTPDISDAKLSALLDGQMEHWVRMHLKWGSINVGFMVDLFWSHATVQGYLAPLIDEAIATTAPAAVAASVFIPTPPTATPTVAQPTPVTTEPEPVTVIEPSPVA